MMVMVVVVVMMKEVMAMVKFGSVRVRCGIVDGEKKRMRTEKSKRRFETKISRRTFVLPAVGDDGIFPHPMWR